MIVHALALAMIAPSGSVQTPDVAPTEARYVAQVEAQLRSCGIAAKPRRLAYEDILQEYSLSLDESGLEDKSVECLANSPLLDSLTIEFTDSRLDALYRTAWAARPDVKTSYAKMIEQQRSWLDERGLLVGMPKLDPNQPLSTYSAAVETHCGVLPGSIFIADEKTRGLTYVGDDNPSQAQVMCVFGIITLAMMDGSAPNSIISGEDSAP